MRLHRLDLVLDRALEQPRAVPARDEVQPCCLQDRARERPRRAETCCRARRLRSRRASPPTRQVSSEFCSPSSGRSSLVQVSGLMPMRTITLPAVCLPPRALVGCARAFSAQQLRGASVTATSHHAPPSAVPRRGSVSITTTAGLRGARCALLQRGFKRGQACRPSRPARPGCAHARRNRRAARRRSSRLLNDAPPVARLQALDAAEAAVVEHHDGQLGAERDRGRDLGVHHQVAAVADQHADLALRLRELDAQPAGDLVAHARVAVFEVVAGGVGCARHSLCSSPGRPPAAQTTMRILRQTRS